MLRPVDLLVVIVTIPAMFALAFLVKSTRLGKAMRATSQNPLAAQLMGINVERVIAATFLVGGALAGVAAPRGDLHHHCQLSDGLSERSVRVHGGCAGRHRQYSGRGARRTGVGVGAIARHRLCRRRWTSAIVFVILILILVFRPSGLLGSTAKEKV